jgi:G3E family GTPase
MFNIARNASSFRLRSLSSLLQNRVSQRNVMTKEVFINAKAKEARGPQEKKLSATPITVLSGFLGAGKTTFLNHLLQNQKGLKFGLVVNDMASVNVDAKQVRSQTQSLDGIDTMELQNGCICCSLAEDLIASLSKLVEMAELKGAKYDHIIVECSGIAEPRRIREFFQQADDYGVEMVKKVKLDTLITVVDAMTFFTLFGSDTDIAHHRELAYRPEEPTNENDGNSQRKVTELLLEQVECADVILINKCDLLVNPQDVLLVEKVSIFLYFEPLLLFSLMCLNMCRWCEV